MQAKRYINVWNFPFAIDIDYPMQLRLLATPSGSLVPRLLSPPAGAKNAVWKRDYPSGTNTQTHVLHECSSS